MVWFILVEFRFRTWRCCKVKPQCLLQSYWTLPQTSMVYHHLGRLWLWGPQVPMVSPGDKGVNTSTLEHRWWWCATAWRVPATFGTRNIGCWKTNGNPCPGPCPVRCRVVKGRGSKIWGGLENLEMRMWHCGDPLKRPTVSFDWVWCVILFVNCFAISASKWLFQLRRADLITVAWQRQCIGTDEQLKKYRIYSDISGHRYLSEQRIGDPFHECSR
jgi:hypothetical protein